jgi:hypothetical protein
VPAIISAILPKARPRPESAITASQSTAMVGRWAVKACQALWMEGSSVARAEAKGGELS